jgi:DNA-binding response OmpR family regulator
MDRDRPLVLVVDDEENIRHLLRLTFEGDFDVAEAGDGQEGFVQALAVRPDLIVSDIMMPRLDGYGFYRRLKARPETAAIPFVFLSAKREIDERVVGLEMGADDYVVKPFSTKELKAKARSLLRKAKEARGSGSLAGHLAEVDLTEVLQLIEMGRKTGMLVLRNGEESGQVYFRNGEIVYARLDPWRGEEAYFTLLSWRTGEFVFAQQPVEVEDNIGGKGQELLMEGIRLLDELAEARRRLPPPETRLAPVPCGDPLAPAIARVVGSFRAGESVRDAAARSGLPPVRFYPLAAEALGRGLLAVEGAQPGKRELLACVRKLLESV